MATVDVGWVETVSSLSLVAVAVALSLWLRLGLARSMVEASLRAAVQLLLVGLVFSTIFDDDRARLWGWLWVLVMVTIASVVVQRRAPAIPGLRAATFVATFVSTAVSLGLVFGLGVFDDEPATVVVIAGITIGNVLPAAVLAARELENQFRDGHGQIEALLSMGLGRAEATMFVAPRAAGTALVGQIERTKVVGLIALPGAMTGLLLAGVDPVDAVLVQIIVMYLILGATAITVCAVVWIGARNAFTPDLRIADWTRPAAAPPG